MNTLSGILEQTQAAIDFQWNFNRHEKEWKDKALNNHDLSKIRSKFNLEGECADCRSIFQAPLNPTVCEFCGSSDVRSTYFC